MLWVGRVESHPKHHKLSFEHSETASGHCGMDKIQGRRKKEEEKRKKTEDENNALFRNLLVTFSTETLNN